MATKHFLGGRIILGTEFAGYKFKFFEPGTSTLKTTYKDSALTVGNENTSTVTLDANGAAQIWFDGNADVVFYTTADVVVYSDDDINLTSSTSSTGSGNLAKNPSFEDDTDADGIPDNWTRTLYTGGTFTLDTTDQFNGQKSIKFVSTGTGGGYVTSTDTFAVSPSVAYTVGFAIKSTADVRNVVEVLWYQDDGSASAVTASTTVYDNSATNPTSWTEKWYDATSPSDAAFAKLRLTGCHSSDATAGTARFDSVTFSDLANKRFSLFTGVFNANIHLPQNFSFTASVAANALTFALKGNDGDDPSSSNPVYIPFRNPTITTGTTSWISVTAATSLVISSGSTMGTLSTIPHRIWLVGFNDGGTFRLGAVNCKTYSTTGVNAVSTTIYPLIGNTIRSSTAEGGAGAADSAGVIYTGTAVTSKSMVILGYIESTQTTAGTWATAPSTLQLYYPGMKLPGDSVQTVSAGKTDTFTTGSATYTDITNMTVTLTPTSSPNCFRIESSYTYSNTAATDATYILLDRGGTSLAVGEAASNRVQCSDGNNFGSGNTLHSRGGIFWLDNPSTVSALTYKLRMRVSGNTGTFNSSGADADNSGYGRTGACLIVTEIQV